MRLSPVAILSLGGLALALAAPLGGMAQEVPLNQNFSMPTPEPRPTISGTPLPYPAYGTPAPDVQATKPKKGVPPTVTLDQSVKLAVALSPVFANENAQWAAIHARYTSSVQALYPGLSASGSLTQQQTVTNSITTVATPGPGITPGRQTLYYGGKTLSESGTISLQQLIFDGGRTIANIKSSKEADYAGRATLLRQLQTLELNVANAYFLVLQDNATVVADNQLVHEFEVNEASVQAQIRNGAAARSDIATAAYQTAQARGNLVTAQGAAIAAQAAFATTLGLDADSEVVPKDIGRNEPSGSNPDYQKALTRALIMRPDYIAAQHTVISAQDNLRYAKLARFPLVEGIANYSTSRQVSQYAGQLNSSSQILTNGYVPTSVIGIQISVPIYDQGLTNYNVAVAASQLDQAIDSLQQTKLQVESDVRGGLANLISARSALVQAHAALVAAQVSLDATQAQYKVGATTIVSVVTTEANLSSAQAAYITALYGVQTAQQNYLYATGFIDVQL